MEEIFVPGRTEIIGNHTDHQGGCVVASTLNIGMRLTFRPRTDQRIELTSKNFQKLSWPPSQNSHPSELMLGESLRLGGKGWEGELVSELPSGGGLSSSAAFCALLLRVQEHLGGLNLSEIQRAELAREIEIKAMNKPCGLMDQMVISAGGTIFIDFKSRPFWENLGANPFPGGWSLWLINTMVSHEDLTADYAAITLDMRQVAEYFGKSRLADVPPTELISLSAGKLPTRAVLRSLHFITEQQRVMAFRDAWKKGQWELCLELVNQSGESSGAWLQNLVSSDGNRRVEELLAFMKARRLMRGYPGAERIHGGGFGGYIQAYVPTDETEMLLKWIELQNLKALQVWQT